MDWFPDEPAVPEAQRGEAACATRYEDITQDGRIHLLVLPHALGDVLWRQLLVGAHWVPSAQRSGIVPILARFVLEGGEGPISVRSPLTGRGCFQVARAGDRALLDMWVALTAPVGRTHGPPPPNAGEVIPVGRVYAEHVFTRPFGPPDQRKVSPDDVAAAMLRGAPVERPWRPLEAVLEAAPTATMLDDGLSSDGATVCFGLNHTDSNQHVNSLVYPRLFIDAALRRLAAHGLPTDVLARRLEVAYRKPCFAGERVTIRLRAFSDGESTGALGGFFADGEPKPRCVIQIRFAR